jgi:transposase-like protein
MICPRCKKEINVQADKEWKYRQGLYTVKHYKCSNCWKGFNGYFRDGKLSFTIPKPKKPK